MKVWTAPLPRCPGWPFRGSSRMPSWRTSRRRSPIGCRCRGDATRAYACRVGLRARLDLGGASSGDLQLDAAIRVDAKQVALGGTTNPPPHGAPAAGTERHTQWRVAARQRGHGAGTPAAAAGVGLVAASRLGGQSRRCPDAAPAQRRRRDSIDLPDIVTRLTSPLTLPLDGPRPATGTPDALLVDLFLALGLVVSDGTGALALALDELAAAAAQPIDRLGPRMPALLDVVGAAAGLTRWTGPIWSLGLTGTPIELTLGAAPWRIGVRTFNPATNATSLRWRRR